jgi:hypothetical protein
VIPWVHLKSLPRLVNPSLVLADPEELAKLPTLRFINPYGWFYVNQLQVEAFLDDWRHLYDSYQELDERRFLEEIEALAIRCLNDVDLFLVFVGD